LAELRQAVSKIAVIKLPIKSRCLCSKTSATGTNAVESHIVLIKIFVRLSQAHRSPILSKPFLNTLTNRAVWKRTDYRRISRLRGANIKARRDYADFLNKMKNSSARKMLSEEQLDALEAKHSAEITNTWQEVLQISRNYGAEVY